MRLMELDEQLRTALTDRYRIDREIGRGGMATVFLATEVHPPRPVAVKVLDPELATSVARERFLREVEFSSQLAHPNIVPIFGSGEADGLLYYVMPYIEGQSLRVRLAQEGALPPDEALEIIYETAAALDYAHSKGVVHRDIKPENILLAHGHAVVADFGIARALCVACDDNLTLGGVPIGTPGYMSPEQGNGDEVDGRSDVYSLAAVMYEMLTGQPAFPGPTMEAIIASRYTQPVPSLKAAGWNHSDTIDRAVHRALQLDPENRFNSISDFVKAFRPRTSGFIPNTVDAYPPPQPAPRTDRAVAVLPFANLSPDPENEYFSDGITEDIITQLSKIRELHVTSRTSVLQYKGTQKSLGQIGRELAVTHVLEGSVRRAGNRVRVVAQLVDAQADRHVWAERYDRELTDIFAIQDEIAEHIATALQMTLTPKDVAKLQRKPTDNLDAYNLYLQGRYHWAKFTPAGVQRAIELFNQAVDLDNRYALAHAGLADSYVLLTSSLGVLAPNDGMPKAKAAALRALECDDELPDALTVMGTVLEWYDWNWHDAPRYYERALRVDPELEEGHLMLAFHHGSQLRFEEALQAARAAQRHHPTSLPARGLVAMQLYLARRFDEALEQIGEVIEMDATFPPGQIVRQWIHTALGDTEGALDAARKAMEPMREISPRRAAFGCALVSAGHRDEAGDILQQLKDRRGSQYVSALDIALLESFLGNTDDAFRWLDTAVDERAVWLSHLAADPIWDRLRDDPRFDELLQKLDLPYPAPLA